MIVKGEKEAIQKAIEVIKECKGEEAIKGKRMSCEECRVAWCPYNETSRRVSRCERLV